MEFELQGFQLVEFNCITCIAMGTETYKAERSNTILFIRSLYAALLASLRSDDENGNVAINCNMRMREVIPMACLTFSQLGPNVKYTISKFSENCRIFLKKDGCRNDRRFKTVSFQLFLCIFYQEK